MGKVRSGVRWWLSRYTPGINKGFRFYIPSLLPTCCVTIQGKYFVVVVLGWWWELHHLWQCSWGYTWLGVQGTLWCKGLNLGLLGAEHAFQSLSHVPRSWLFGLGEATPSGIRPTTGSVLRSLLAVDHMLCQWTVGWPQTRHGLSTTRCLTGLLEDLNESMCTRCLE